MRLQTFIGLLGILVVSFFSVALAAGYRYVAVSVLAGALTGLLESLILYPVENLKTQQQLQRGSLCDVFHKTMSRHGFKGFYYGIVPVMLGAVPTQALRWGTFTAYCSLSTSNCATSLIHITLAAAVSGIVVSLFIGVPIETLKTEQIHMSAVVPWAESPVTLTVPSHQHWSGGEEEAGNGIKLNDGSYDTVLNHPNKSLFKGFAPTVLKKVLNQAIRFPVHHAALTYLCFFSRVPREHCVANDHLFLSFLAGAVAGVSSIFLTQPVDLAKTRMQGLSSHRYRNLLHCWALILREESWSVLCDGVMARILRSSLGSALTFTFVPLLQTFFSKHI